MTAADYLALRAAVRPVLEQLEGELAGTFFPEREQMVAQHLIFTQCDSYLTDGGACQHWPTGRAVFLNTARTFVVWVGEEDHLRIISMQQGGDLAAVYTR